MDKFVRILIFMVRLIRLFAIASVLFCVFSCSTTKFVPEGRYRLAKNNIEVLNDNNFSSGKLEPYIKQKPNTYFFLGWNPFLNLYNLSGKNEKSFINKLIRKAGVAPVIYEPDLVEESINNIKTHLEYLGYYNSNVFARINHKDKKVVVDYKVVLGKRYEISKLEYSLPNRGTFPSDFAKDSVNVTIKPGNLFSPADLEKETERSAAQMRKIGYYGFTKNYYSFLIDTISEKGKAIVEMKIGESARNETQTNPSPIRKYYIGNVSISYPKSLRFRDKILKNINTILPGELYDERNVNNTYSRFSSLRTFSGVNIEMSTVDTNKVDCSINLTPSPLQGFKINLEASSNSTGLIGISPQFNYFHKNIFRGGEWLTLGFMGNFQFKLNNKDIHSTEIGGSAGLSFPRLLGLPHSWFKGPYLPRTEINFSYNYQGRLEYKRNILSTSLGYTGNTKGKLFYQFYPLQISIVKLYSLDQNFYQTLTNNPFLRNAYDNHFDVGAGAALYYTTNTSVNPVSDYHYARFQVDISGNILSAFRPLMNRNSDNKAMIWGTPYSQYVRTELSVGKTWTFGERNAHAIATRFLCGIGYAYGNSSALPFEKQFYSGGANGLRGWQARSIGPGLSSMDNTFSIPSQMGDMKLEANIEYRFKMFWKLAGAIFADMGNVWTIQNGDYADKSNFRFNDFYKGIAIDLGAGLRIDLSFILLRIDLGVQVHDPANSGNRWNAPKAWLDKDNYALHFGVGYPF